MAGRPRLFDESQALDAAMELFWRQGFEATSLAQLREATKLSSASLYGGFGSKDELFEKVVHHYVSRPGSVISLVRDTADLPASAALRVLLHRTVDEQLDPTHPPGCLVALAATVGPGNTRPGQVVATQRTTDREAIRSIWARAAAEGALTDQSEVDDLTFLTHTFVLGIATQIHDGATASELHRAADTLLKSLQDSGC